MLVMASPASVHSELNDPKAAQPTLSGESSLVRFCLIKDKLVSMQHNFSHNSEIFKSIFTKFEMGLSNVLPFVVLTFWSIRADIANANDQNSLVCQTAIYRRDGESLRS